MLCAVGNEGVPDRDPSVRSFQAPIHNLIGFRNRTTENLVLKQLAEDMQS